MRVGEFSNAHKTRKVDGVASRTLCLIVCDVRVAGSGFLPSPPPPKKKDVYLYSYSWNLRVSSVLHKLVDYLKQNKGSLSNHTLNSRALLVFFFFFCCLKANRISIPATRHGIRKTIASFDDRPGGWMDPQSQTASNRNCWSRQDARAESVKDAQLEQSTSDHGNAHIYIYAAPLIVSQED